tara:strand:+ start:93 stop:311 length:219 start_codon:yes stop_codon:yes gene_type:complete
MLEVLFKNPTIFNYLKMLYVGQENFKVDNSAFLSKSKILKINKISKRAKKSTLFALKPEFSMFKFLNHHIKD